MHLKSIPPALVVMSVCWLVPAARAFDTGFNLAYGLEYTDNARLVPTDKQEELTQTIAVGVFTRHTGRNLELNATATAAFRDYNKHTSEDEVLGGLTGSARWLIVPERFHWNFEDVFTQAPINPTGSNTPSNRQNVNVFSTGPDAFLHFSAANTLQLSARRTLSSFSASENSDTSRDDDSERDQYAARWQYRWSSATDVSLNLESESTEFDDPISNPNFDRRDAFVRIAHRAARNLLTLDGGKTFIERDGTDDTEGGIARLSWVREISSDTNLTVTASHELSDVVREVLGSGQLPTTTPGGSQFSSNGDLFVSRKVDVQYSRRGSLGTNTFRLFRSEKEHELNIAEDEQAHGGNVDIGYDFAQAVRSSVFAQHVITEFPNVPRENRDKSIGARLHYQATRLTAVIFQVGHNTRTSTDPLSEYKENRVGLTISYQSKPGGGR